MQLPSLVFLLYFLPIVLLLAAVCKGKYRLLLLSSAGLVYCALQGLFLLTMIVGSVAGSWLTLRLMGNHASPKKRNGILLAIGLLLQCGILAAGKALLQFPPIPLVICVMQAAECLLQRYRGNLPLPSLLAYCCYQLSLTRLWAGPVLSWQNYTAIIQHPQCSLVSFGKGIADLIAGFAKLVLLVLPMFSLWQMLSEKAAMNTLTALGAWFGLPVIFLVIFYGLGGAAQMGQGIAKLFGYSYCDAAAADAERRTICVISIIQWAKRVFFSDLIAEQMLLRLCLLILAVGLLFGCGWNGLLWVCMLMLILLTERMTAFKWQQRMPVVIRRAFSGVFILLSLGVIGTATLKEAVGYYAALLGTNGFWFDSDVIYAIRTEWIVLAAGVLLLFPLRNALERRSEKSKVGAWLYAIGAPLVQFALLVLCIAQLLSLSNG